MKHITNVRHRPRLCGRDTDDGEPCVRTHVLNKDSMQGYEWSYTHGWFRRCTSNPDLAELLDGPQAVARAAKRSGR